MKKRHIIIPAVILVAVLFSASLMPLFGGKAPAPSRIASEEPTFLVTSRDDSGGINENPATEPVISSSVTSFEESTVVVIGVVAETELEEVTEPVPEYKPEADTEEEQADAAPDETPLATPPDAEVSENHAQDTDSASINDPVSAKDAEDRQESELTSELEPKDEPEPKAEEKPDIDTEDLREDPLSEQAVFDDPAEEPEKDDKPAPHVHSYVSRSVDPTCSEDGMTIYSCECGDAYAESIEKLGHDWVLAAEYEVVDRESYCSFRYAVIICTSPACYENGDRTTAPLSVFSAKDYGYSSSSLYDAYNAHAYAHLANGEQASYTAESDKDTAPADMYDLLLEQQNSKPKSVLNLTLIPAVTHTEATYRCSRCGAEK